MAKSTKKIVEGRSKQQRQKVRKSLGKLKDLTVQPRTRHRYDHALRQFLDWLTREGLRLPTQASQMDNVVSDYLEFLWASGEGKSVANNALAALQDYEPSLKKKLPGSWRLMKAWNSAEIPNRAPPLTLSLLNALCGWSVMQDCPEFGLSLRVAFFGLLRTGELLSLRAKDIYLNTPKGPAVISLGLTKSGARQGAAESITIHDSSVIPSLYRWKCQAKPHDFLTSKPHAWRNLFNRAIEGLKLQEFAYRPYSLRRGGATFFFQHHGSFDRLLVQGRWGAAKTARIYLNDGLAQLSEISVPNSHLRPFLLLYQKHPILEPGPRKAPRPGGRGKPRKTSPFFAFSKGFRREMNPQKTTSGKRRIPKVVPLKCSGSWSAGLAAAAMRGTGGHPLLPGLAEVEGCRGPERLLFQLLVPSILSISDKLAATREKDRRL